MLLIVIALIICLVLFLIYPSKRWNMKENYYAHRGLFSKDQEIRENSLEAFDEAIKHQFGIELDVQMTNDEQLVVFHDNDLQRLFKDNRRIKDLTLEQCQSFMIPSFEEVLKLVDGQASLIIEIKPTSQRVKVVNLVLSKLNSYQGEYCIESFDPRIVYLVKKKNPDIIRGQLIMSYRNYDNKLTGLVINSLLYNFLTRPDFIATEIGLFNKNPMISLTLLFGGQQVLWTIHLEHFNQTRGYPIIFEHFVPKT